MSDDVAAVLARGMASADGFPGAAKPEAYERDAQACLAALTAENYAVVKLPEGVAVAHGARLSKWTPGGWLYAIEDTP